MAVGSSWTDPTASPPDTLTGATLTQTAWEDVLANLNYLGGADGKSGQHGGLPFFRNVADKGKELQLAATSAPSVNIAVVTLNNTTDVTITFAVAFSSSPTVVLVSQVGKWTSACVRTISGSGATASGLVDNAGTLGAFHYLAIGAP